MKLVKIKKVPKYNTGGTSFIKDNTGLGTYLYDQPLEMQLRGTNPIVGGPMDVIAKDQRGKRAYIPAGTKDPTMMYGKVKEVPLMRDGGNVPIDLSANKSVGYYNPHRDADVPAHATGLDEPSKKDINSTITEVDEEDANVEAEKDELVMKPDLSGLYKVKGKTHKQGGTALALEPGSFIFSNDPKLAVDEEEAELFDFQEPTSKSDKENTPAKVLQREVKPKEYNTLIATLNDPDADKISKITAALMLEKYHQKIGRVAFLQEAKKDKPIPAFAMGTAPNKDYDLDALEQKEDMYAQKGGAVQFDAMYGPQTRRKKTYPDIYPGGRTTLGRFTPTGIDNQYDNPYGPPKETNAEDLIKSWEAKGVHLRGQPNDVAQGMMYDWALKNNPDLARDMWTQFGMTAKGTKLGLNTNDLSQEGLQRNRPGYTDKLFGVRTFRPSSPLKTVAPVGTVPFAQAPYSIPTPPLPSQPGAPAEQIPSLGYDIKGKLTSAQLAHLGMLGLNAMSVNKYYPKREQVDLPEVNLDTINEQPYINDINNQSFQAYRAAANGDPRMARLNQSNIYGRSLDAISKTRGNIQNQNTQIQNQENLTNLGQRTNQVMQNAQFDDRYYDQVQTTRQNYDTEKRYANNAVFSALNQYQSQADQLAWGLASVNKYGRRLVTDPKTGKKYYKPVPLYEATSRGINYNADVADINLASGADRVNSAEEAIQILKQNGININDYKTVYAFSNMLKALGQAKNPLYSTNPDIP